MEYKYFKPKSLTWWASFAPLGIGVFLASESLHGMTSLTSTINELTDHTKPYWFINAGLVGIGMRGKDG